MALFLGQQGPKSELQEKITRDLQDRLAKTEPLGDLPNGSAHDDSHYATMRPSSIVIGIVIIILIAVVLWYASKAIANASL